MEITATLVAQAVVFLVLFFLVRALWGRFLSKPGARRARPRFGDGRGGGDGGGGGE
jgi:hypothetical protein